MPHSKKSQDAVASQSVHLLKDDALQQSDRAVSSDSKSSFRSDACGIKENCREQTVTDGPWSPTAKFAALIVFLGTTFSAVLGLHVSNDIPDYFFAIAVFTPISGLLFYPLVVASLHITGVIRAGLSRMNILPTLKYSTLIGLFFSISNIFRDYGISGQNSGTPDVSAVYSLILQKLVVPVSLLLELALARTFPSYWQIAGVMVLMGGIVVTALTYNSSDGTYGHSDEYGIKVFCIIVSTVPLALGFWIVKQARSALEHVTPFELWMVLCLPETIFSVGLSYIGQIIKNNGTYVDGSLTTSLANGLACLVIGKVPKRDRSIPCEDAAIFTWLGLIPGYAFNLAIPVLIHLRGSTSVPLFRALALPAASLLAMSGFDDVIKTKFRWEGVVGVLLAVTGLLLFYKRRSKSGDSEKEALVQNDN